jgi:glycosyltransferase involved in cell wall biosynthesis
MKNSAFPLKVALVHDYLNQFGGAERVLETLSEIFPEAPIYTLFYDEKLTDGHFKNRLIKTSFIDKRFVRRHHRLFIPFFAKAAETINLGENYDLIISDSAGFGKGVRYGKSVHIAYIHSPLRYAWEPQMYLGTLFSKYLIKFASPIMAYLTKWDKRAALKPELLLTNSNFTAEKIKKFYGRAAQVIHPPVNTDIFYFDPKIKKQDYFLAFGRIIHYKRFDLIVHAFNELGLPLKIVGSGPEKEKIRKLIKSPNIEILSEVKDDELRKIITGAKALIFPQVEDFGLVAAEAITCGTPVIAYSEGGAKDIVQSGINGIFFKKQNTETLIKAVKEFLKMNFDGNKVAESGKRFSKESFKEKLMKIINNSLQKS